MENHSILLISVWVEPIQICLEIWTLKGFFEKAVCSWVLQNTRQFIKLIGLGRQQPSPTRLTNPTRSTDIWATTKKSVILVVDCNCRI